MTAASTSPAPARSPGLNELSRFIIFLELRFFTPLLCQHWLCSGKSGMRLLAVWLLLIAYCPGGKGPEPGARWKTLSTASYWQLRTQCGPIFRRRHPDMVFEHAVETGNGTETRGIDNLGNSQGCIDEKRLGFFDADE